MLDVIYRVNMLKNGKWERRANYATYDEAELAACGLVTGGKAIQVHILEIGANGGRIVADITSTPKAGWLHGAAAVKRVS
jgi:hypothetical protein